MNNDFFINTIRNAYTRKGYKFFENGDFNLNFGAIRCATRRADYFDDIGFIANRIEGVWQVFTWPKTTDPGLHGLESPSRPQGCAILVPDQYRGVYTFGYHKDDKSRPCLKQTGKMSVYRDWNKDDVLDLDYKSIETGYFGINFHNPYRDRLEMVGAASEGCQVPWLQSDHDKAMMIYHSSRPMWSDKITYTLFDEADMYE